MSAACESCEALGLVQDLADWIIAAQADPGLLPAELDETETEDFIADCLVVSDWAAAAATVGIALQEAR